MLSVVAPNILSVVILSEVLLNLVKRSVVMLSVIMLSVVMLCFVAPNTLTVVMLSEVEPFSGVARTRKLIKTFGLKAGDRTIIAEKQQGIHHLFQPYLIVLPVFAYHFLLSCNILD
jgi:hypothetical protein